MFLFYFFLSNVYSGFSLVTIAVCPDPGIPSEGKRFGDNFKTGSTVTFKCRTNYDLIGNNTMRCEDGVWSGKVPICQGIKCYLRWFER